MTRRADRFAILLPVATIVLALIVAGCATAGPPVTGPDVPTQSTGAGPGSITLVAQDLAFDRSELIVPAGQAFRLIFENRDWTPHNVSIAGAGVTRFSGEIFGGPDSRSYVVPALENGTYVFRCDLHTSMTGEIVATPPGIAD